jgi:hypothetical protein
VNSNERKVTYEILLYNVSTESHNEEIIFDIMIISSYDAVFRLS